MAATRRPSTSYVLASLRALHVDLLLAGGRAGNDRGRAIRAQASIWWGQDTPNMNPVHAGGATARRQVGPIVTRRARNRTSQLGDTAVREAALLPGRYHRPLATPRADGPSALSAPDRVSASGSRDQGTCNAKGPGADRPGRGRLIRPAGESPMTIRPDVRGSRAHPAPRLPGRTAPSRRAIDRRELAGRPRQRNRLAGPPPQGCLRRRSPRHDASRLDGPVAAGGADAFRRRR